MTKEFELQAALEEINDERTGAYSPIEKVSARLQAHLIAATQDLTEETRRSGKRLVALTAALVVLTVVLLALTGVLVVRA